MDEEKFNSSVKYLFILSQIFCLTPISPFIKNYNQHENLKVKCLYFAWSVFWILLMSVIGFYITYVLRGMAKEGPLKMITGIIYIALFLSNVIFLINNIVKRNNFPKIMNTFWKVDNTLMPRCGVRVYEKEKLCSIKHITVVCLLYIALNVSLCCALGSTSIYSITFNFTANLPFLVNGIMSIHFNTLVKKLKKRLKIINDILESYTKATHSTKWKTPRKIINFLEDSSEESVNRQPGEIQLIQSVYIDLYNTKELINSTYGITIVFEILTCYSLSVTAVIGGIDAATETIDVLVIIFNTFLLAYVFLMLAWILLKCDQVFDESKKIISNVLKLMVGNDISQDVKCDLNIFLSMMRDMPLQFTPCGLFTLNLPFLCSTVGVICTYVVVMIQIN
ncbi:hypothetical protein L9F63_014804 [Diploptera punctata]|uniref:Gustatory receptor n=1 Tax=Diploptera punctata TaxID=6984 RepID=A0AAD8A7T2_DIPPU|nr:hypothetical protein L9F63_014804 [Diploptera punctata]